MSVIKKIKNTALGAAAALAIYSPFWVAKNNKLPHSNHEISATVINGQKTDAQSKPLQENVNLTLEQARFKVMELKEKIAKGDKITIDDLKFVQDKINNSKFQYEIKEKDRQKFIKNPGLKIFAQAHSPKHGIVYVFEKNQLVNVDVFVGSPRAFSGKRTRAMDMETPKGLFTFANRTRSYNGFLGINTSAHAREVFQKQGYVREINEYEKTHGQIDTYQDQTLFKQWHEAHYPRASMRMYDAIGLHGGGNTYPWTYGCLATSDEFISDLIPKVQNVGFSKVPIFIAPHE